MARPAATTFLSTAASDPAQFDPQHRDGGSAGNQLLQQLQPLAVERPPPRRQPVTLPPGRARWRQARPPDRDRDDDDRDRARGSLAAWAAGSRRDDDVHRRRTSSAASAGSRSAFPRRTGTRWPRSGPRCSRARSAPDGRLRHAARRAASSAQRTRSRHLPPAAPPASGAARSPRRPARGAPVH